MKKNKSYDAKLYDSELYNTEAADIGYRSAQIVLAKVLSALPKISSAVEFGLLL